MAKTITVTIPEGKRQRHEKPGSALTRALAQIKEDFGDRLTPALWLERLYATPGVDRIFIRVFSPNGGYVTRTYLKDAQPFTPDIFANAVEPEAVEMWLATNFSDGKFSILAGQGREMHAGLGPFPVAVGITEGAIERPASGRRVADIHADMMESIKNKVDILNAQDLANSLDRKARGEDDEMKMTDVAVLIESIAKLNQSQPRDTKTDEILEKILTKLDGQPATTPGLGAIIGPVAELLSKNPSGAWPFLRMFLNRVAPEARGPVEPPSKTFMESAQELVTGLGPVIAQFAQTPFGQAIVAKLLQGVTPPTPNGTTVTEHPPIIEHEPQRPAIPPRPRGPFDDVLDAIVDQLRRAPDDRDFKALVGFLDSIVLDPQTDQRLLDRIAPIAKTTDELARVALRQIDARLVEQVWDGTRAFLDYLREHPREDDE